MTLTTKIALLLDIGKRKAYQEDFADYFEPDDPQVLKQSGSIFIVADGVGRSSRGDLASRYAVKSLLHEYYHRPDREIGDRLEKVVKQAGNEIHAHAEGSDSYRMMATTLVAAVIRGNSLTIANVGDSRAYLLRSGKIKQLSEDHSLVEEMLRNGTLTPEEAKKSSLKNQITRSLGGEKDVKVDVFRDIPVEPGDQVLLCSDGLSRYTSNEFLADQMGKGSPDQVVKRLVSYANRQGGVDNISALVIKVGELIEERIPAGPPNALPPAVHWESLEEQLAEPAGAGSGREDRKKKILVPALAGTALLVVLGALVFTPFGTILFSGAPSPTAVEKETIIVLEDIEPTPTAQPLAPTIMPTQEPTPSITEESPIMPEIAPCLVRYQQPDPSTNSLFLLLRDDLKKDISYQAFIAEYAPLVSCLEEVESGCAYDPTAYEWVEAGWLIELPEIETGNCLAAGGTVVLEGGVQIAPSPGQ